MAQPGALLSVVLARKLEEWLFRNSLTNIQLEVCSGRWLGAQVELTVDSLLIKALYVVSSSGFLKL